MLKIFCIFNSNCGTNNYPIHPTIHHVAAWFITSCDFTPDSGTGFLNDSYPSNHPSPRLGQGLSANIVITGQIFFKHFVKDFWERLSMVKWFDRSTQLTCLIVLMDLEFYPTIFGSGTGFILLTIFTIAFGSLCITPVPGLSVRHGMSFTASQGRSLLKICERFLGH